VTRLSQDLTSDLTRPLSYFPNSATYVTLISSLTNQYTEQFQQMYPVLCITADSAFQDAGHVIATRWPTPLADKLVKYSQLCSSGDCVTTCYVSRDTTLPHTSIQQVQIKLSGTT